jgi:hypothetical protein
MAEISARSWGGMSILCWTFTVDITCVYMQKYGLAPYQMLLQARVYSEMCMIINLVNKLAALLHASGPAAGHLAVFVRMLIT